MKKFFVATRKFLVAIIKLIFHKVTFLEFIVPAVIGYYISEYTVWWIAALFGVLLSDRFEHGRRIKDLEAHAKTTVVMSHVSEMVKIIIQRIERERFFTSQRG